MVKISLEQIFYVNPVPHFYGTKMSYYVYS